MSELLTQYPALWVPTVGFVWSVVMFAWWAGQGQMNATPTLAFLGLVSTALCFWAMFIMMDQVSGSWPWQYQVLFCWYVWAAAANVYYIALGGKRDTWGVGSAFFSSLIALGIWLLWLKGIPS